MITPDRPIERMTLRQLMSHSEKLAHGVREHVTTTYFKQLGDLRELARPVRRKSHYPTVTSLKNEIADFEQSMATLSGEMDALQQACQAIHKQIKAERGPRR